MKDEEKDKEVQDADTQTAKVDDSSAQTKKEDTKEKTFTQTEVDNIVKQRLARESKKEDTGIKAEMIQGNVQETLSDIVFNKYVNAEIKSALAICGVNPSKVSRACRLVDTDKVLVNNNLDEAKLKEEIDSVLAEFPELKITKERESEQSKGFKFGSEGNQNIDIKDDALSNIFGKRKK